MGRDVMSCFDEGYISVFDSFKVCDNNKVHDIIRGRRRRRTPARRSRRPMILTEVIHHDVTDPPGLLLLVVLAVNGVVIHQLICTKSCKTC